MNHYMDFDPYAIRERNEQMIRDVNSLRLEERLREARGVATASAKHSCCNRLRKRQSDVAAHNEGGKASEAHVDVDHGGAGYGVDDGGRRRHSRGTGQQPRSPQRAGLELLQSAGVGCALRASRREQLERYYTPQGLGHG